MYFFSRKEAPIYKLDLWGKIENKDNQIQNQIRKTIPPEYAQNLH